MAKKFLELKQVCDNSIVDQLNSIDAQKYGLSYIPGMARVPVTNIFGRTMYLVRGGKMTAFNIIMCAMNSINGTISFYVSLPGEQPKWVDSFLTHGDVVFHSKDEYFSYVTTGIGGVKWEVEYIADVLIDNWHRPCRYSFNNSYSWDKQLCRPVRCHGFIQYLIAKEDGLSAVFAEKCGTYWSAASCAKDKIDGMEIIEFNESHEESLKIEVAKSSSPKIHVLKFIEE